MEMQQRWNTDNVSVAAGMELKRNSVVLFELGESTSREEAGPQPQSQGALRGTSAPTPSQSSLRGGLASGGLCARRGRWDVLLRACAARLDLVFAAAGV